MTDDTPVSELEGRELDKEVAREIMGWETMTVRDLREENTGGSTPFSDMYEDEIVWVKVDGDWYLHRTDGNPPRYSSDIVAAWDVVEGILSCKVVTEEWDEKPFDLCKNYSFKDEWSVFFKDYGYKGKGSTAPEAICRAALRAVREGSDE